MATQLTGLSTYRKVESCDMADDDPITKSGTAGIRNHPVTGINKTDARTSPAQE
jgi:hypothetical protein